MMWNYLVVAQFPSLQSTIMFETLINTMIFHLSCSSLFHNLATKTWAMYHQFILAIYNNNKVSNLGKIRLIEKSNLKEEHHRVVEGHAISSTIRCKGKYYPTCDKNIWSLFSYEQTCYMSVELINHKKKILISKKQGTCHK